MKNLLGKTVSSVEATDEVVIFNFTDGHVATWYHEQDCCEDVHVDDVSGDWDDLVGSPLLVCEGRSNDEYVGKEGDDSNTWTFYTYRTLKGSVDVRWHGSSNGYYSEEVNFLYK